MKNYNVFMRKVVLGVCVMFAFLFFVGSGASVSAVAAEEPELPIVVRWVNGLAVAEDGTYIYDSWAVDETNVSEKKYVLLGQDCAEIMRVAKYPDDVKNGDTTPCEKFSLAMTFSVPEGISSDILVTYENEDALYTFVYSESAGYSFEMDVYPGVYEITEIEVMSDVQGTYKVNEAGAIDVSASDYTGAYEIIVELEEENSSSGEVEETGAPDIDENGDTVLKEDNELLYDTIKLMIAVVILLAIYAIHKYRMQKAEELKR